MSRKPVFIPLTRGSPRVRLQCSVVLALGVGTVLPGTAAHSVPPNYRVDVIGEQLTGFDMNESGTAVGRKLSPTQVGRAFVAPRGEAVQLLPTPKQWTSSDAYAISANGIIVGAVSIQSIATIGSHAAAWFPSESGYSFALLPPLLGDTFSAAFGVNDHGDIVGGSGGLGLGLYPRPVQFTTTQATELAGISTPADVNDNRVVVASNQLLDLNTMSISTIALPPGNWQGFVSFDISNVGNVCGYVAGYSGCSTFPVRHIAAGDWEFVGGCATTTAANSVNDLVDAVAYVANSGVWASFTGEVNVSLGALIAPSEGSWLMTGASTITNRREILASGRVGSDPVTKLIRMAPPLVEDLDGDGRVNASDLALLLDVWGSAGGQADIDGDGAVGASDLSRILAGWTR